MRNTLTVWGGGETRKLSFDAPDTLSHVLAQGGVSVSKPCGGHGNCGKCAVKLTGCVSEPNERERFFGTHLLCQALLTGDAEVHLHETSPIEQIELDGVRLGRFSVPLPGKIGAAVDVGTTTLAMRLYDLTDGKEIGELGAENPQCVYAADVMGRISAALAGDAGTLRGKVIGALKIMFGRILSDAGRKEEQVDRLVITGNTTMLYLLTGQDVACLSRAPFHAERLFDEELEFLNGHAYLPPCISAFVGADATCAVLASGMCRNDDVALLCDIGTNGEIALWKDGMLYVTSTAAGPAFEGTGISCGCGSVRGAIDRVWLEDRTVCLHTIGETEPTGLCGSGLLDAIAVFLELGVIEETGAVEGECLALAPEVKLTRADIRAFQLAKAAVAAGIEALMEGSGTKPGQVSALYIAGGFGGHINIGSAVRVGLIPGELSVKVHFLGNGALAGAERLLLDRGSRGEIQRIAASALPVNLGGDPGFNESFVEHLYFH